MIKVKGIGIVVAILVLALGVMQASILAGQTDHHRAILADQQLANSSSWDDEDDDENADEMIKAKVEAIVWQTFDAAADQDFEKKSAVDPGTFVCASARATYVFGKTDGQWRVFHQHFSSFCPNPCPPCSVAGNT